ncbi:cation:proton antiporter domain-containing protein [Natrialbaceae archaeon A-gly3]
MTDLLTAVSIIFIVAGPFLLVANRFKLPTVPLLIIAGIAAGRFIEEGAVLELAQYGIALLVFSFGVGIQFSAVRTVLVDSEVTALGQVLVVGALGVGCGVILGIPLEEAVYFGIAAALSSTIVGKALLEAEIRQNLVHGRLAQSIHLIQDLLAIMFLLVLGAGTLAADPIATQFGYGLALLIGAVLVNRYLFDLLGKLAGDSSELMIISVVSLLVVFVGAAEYVGVSIVVGAFAAGLAVRHDPAQYLGLFNGLESIKDFFVAIFFVTIGALVAFPTVEKLLIAGILVLLTAVVKPAITAVILMYKGYGARSATLTGLSTDQVSEFALIIAIEALLLGLLTQRIFDAIIFAAAMTMITSSITYNNDERIYRIMATYGSLEGTHRKIDEWSHVPEDVDDHVVIAGYGRQGKHLVETCEELGQSYVVIENDPARREAVESDCAAYVFGDALEGYTWKKANVEDARIIVSTVDSEAISRRILDLETDADVTLRASEKTTALELLKDGALYVSISDLLAGRQLVQYLHALIDGELTPEELREQRMADLNGRTSVDRQHDR